MKVLSRRINFNSFGFDAVSMWVKHELKEAGKTEVDISSLEVVDLPKDFDGINTHDVVLAIKED